MNKRDPREETGVAEGGYDPRQEEVADLRSQEPQDDEGNVLFAALGWEDIYGKEGAHATFSVEDLKMLIDRIDDFGGPLSERQIREAIESLIDKGLCQRCGQGCYSLTDKGASHLG